MDKKNGYVGRIAQGSTQNIKAPNQTGKGQGKHIIRTGNDLRAKK